MLRSDLIKFINDKKTDLKKLNPDFAAKTIDEIFKFLEKNLNNGNRIELRGFGIFSSKIQAAKQGRNPKTGAIINISEKRNYHFKTGKSLFNILNKKD